MKLPAAPQAGSPLRSDKLQGILAKANKFPKSRVSSTQVRIPPGVIVKIRPLIIGSEDMYVMLII